MQHTAPLYNQLRGLGKMTRVPASVGTYSTKAPATVSTRGRGWPSRVTVAWSLCAAGAALPICMYVCIMCGEFMLQVSALMSV